jgi:hypothetical protein
MDQREVLCGSGIPGKCGRAIVMSSMVVDARSFSQVCMKEQQDRHTQSQGRRRGQGRLDAMRLSRGVARVAM